VSTDLVAKSESRDYRDLFLYELNWSAPDHAPVTVELEDGTSLTATNVSSYQGLRVWEVPAFPGTAVEAAVDREILKTTTNRLVIFHEADRQAWRWPSRSSKGGGVVSRPARHVHRTGSPDPRFGDKINAIRLPTDTLLDVNAVLTKVRAAFDVETSNETKRASKLMARMYAAVEKAYPAGYNAKDRDHEISVSLARVLFLLFGDDTEMWTVELFQDFVKDHTQRDGTNIGQRLNELFEVLDTAPHLRGDLPTELAAFPYVNGGIFEEKITLPDLDDEFRAAVLDASAVDWSTISPAIFGSMFQSVRDAKTRRELGEHYTSEENILKTLNPLFLDELRGEFEAALARDTDKKKSNALQALWQRLGELRFMDPACGCGNFIIVAFRELRALELEIMLALQDLAGYTQLALDATSGLRVTLDHFYGLEIDEWPARIAETAMFLTDRQCDLRMKERVGMAPERLPIRRQAKIVVGSALTMDWRRILEPSSSVIVAGNPPFRGKTERTDEQTEDMQIAWGSHYNGEADFVTSWFAKSAQYFGDVNGRWAFVTSNSVCQGVVVAPVFGYLADRGWHVRFAHRTFEWTSDASGKAAVHCVIVGMDRRNDGPRRLFHYENIKGSPQEIVVERINAYLVAGEELLVRDRRRALAPALETDIRFGSMAADNGGLLVSAAEYAAIRNTDPIAVNHIKRFVGAKELLNDKERWCIWMPEAVPSAIEKSAFLRDRFEVVRAFRTEKAKDSGVRASGQTPHRFSRVQQPASDYLCIPRHIPESYEYFPAAYYSPDVISGDANFVLNDPDGFFLGVLSSRIFMIWQKSVGGRIKNDPRFASTVTWNTFPLPRLEPSKRQAVVDGAQRVIAVRKNEAHMPLAEQYEPNKMSPALREAHEALDAAMFEAFELAPDADLLTVQQRLFACYGEAIRTAS
jgi:hypothetical protein